MTTQIINQTAETNSNSTTSKNAGVTIGGGGAVGGNSSRSNSDVEDSVSIISNDETKTSTITTSSSVMSSKKVHETNQMLADAALATGNTNLFIGNISGKYCNEQVLSKIFSKYGTITRIHILTNKYCGFIEYLQVSSAVNAILALHGRKLAGRCLAVKSAISKQTSTPSTTTTTNRTTTASKTSSRQLELKIRAIQQTLACKQQKSF